MTAAELQLSHTVELEVLLNGKKTTLLTLILPVSVCFFNVVE